MKSRRKFSAEFKAKVAVEALKEHASINEIATKHKLHVQQVSAWKREFLDNAASVFESKTKPKKDSTEEEKKKLYETIGQQKMEIDFLKNALS